MTENESSDFVHSDPQDRLYQMFLDANQSSEARQSTDFVESVMLEFDARNARRTSMIISGVRYIRAASLVFATALLPFLAQAVQRLPAVNEAPSGLGVSLVTGSAAPLIFATGLVCLALIPLLTRRA
jgi:hypothetical protein